MYMLSNNEYDILTPNGYESFSGMRNLVRDNVIRFTLSNQKIIKSSPDHKFMLNGTQPILAHELKEGMELFNGVMIDKIESISKSHTLYDVMSVGKDNIFLVDDIVSHNCDFMTSGNSVVPGPTLQWYRDTYVCDPIETRGFDGGYWIWEVPNYTTQYAVIADVARGDGKDYSTFHVLDVEQCKQVAEYQGKPGTKEFGNMLVAVAYEWNDALLVIENANIGWAAIQPAIDRNYPNLYYSHKTELHVVDTQAMINQGRDLANADKMVPGFSTTNKTRPLIISKIEQYFRTRSVIIKSKRTISELDVFIWEDNGKAQARRGYNDDLVIPLGIGLWIRDTALKLKQEGLDLTKATMGGFKKSTPSIMSANQANALTPWKMDIGNTGQQENLTWLIGNNKKK